ncbi:MAG: hypothetical protein IT353_06130 [Gemmatimonadaceae bacterium]|nr:hypothetical protein [Gemmatimonadaceae bacterium]
MHSPLVPVLPLTEARAQLFRLADELLSGAVERVCLTHRGQTDDVVMLRASTVLQMEQELADLRSRLAPDVRPLAGMGTMLVSEEAMLDDLRASRAEQSALATDKRGDVASGLRYARADGPVKRVAERRRSR